MLKKEITDPKVLAISERVLRAAKDVLGDKLVQVYLYGSYARGDYDSESDIDFLILADVPQEEACRQRNSVSERLGDIDLEYDLLVSYGVTAKSLFEQCVAFLPFYKNVKKDGVLLGDY
ncbi:MAG: nucleotidyltransferase domain-containing protein [Oscillospiraceae bacterium]|nr:nucleotidyltransferase domain-containing protein [Oscillospiraceae bacterium]